MQSGYRAIADDIRIGELEFKDCVVAVTDKRSVSDEDGLIDDNFLYTPRIGFGADRVIATVVDDLIDRVMSDVRLNANPLVDEAHHRLPPAGFKYLVTELVCFAAGSPQKYSGNRWWTPMHT